MVIRFQFLLQQLGLLGLNLMVCRGQGILCILSCLGIVPEQLGSLFLHHRFHHMLALLKLKHMFLSTTSITAPLACMEYEDLEAQGVWLLLVRHHPLRLITLAITTCSLRHSHRTGASKMLKTLKAIDSTHGRETNLPPFHHFVSTENQAGGDHSPNLQRPQIPTAEWVSGTGLALRDHQQRIDQRGPIGRSMLKCGLSDEKLLCFCGLCSTMCL